VLDLSDKNCWLNRLTNNTFVHLANTSLTTLTLAGCSSHLVAIEPCVVCPLRTLTVVDWKYTNNKILSVTSALRTFYAFTVSGQEVQTFNLRHFHESKSRALGLHLTASGMAHVLDTCVRELLLARNYIVAVKRGALVRPGSLFNKCLRPLDLSYNVLFVIYPMLFFLWNEFSSLEQLEFQQQRVFSLERAEQMLSERAMLEFDAREHVVYGMTVTLPPQIRFVNVSGAIYLNGQLPAKLTFRNCVHCRNLDASYIRFIGCTCVFEGLGNLEVVNITGSDCYNTSLTFFDAFPRVKTLTMQKMTFAPRFVAQHGRRLFSNLSFLETLDLSYNDLGFLPNDLLSRQPALRKLILLGNNLESLDLDLSFHPNLTLLDLSDNRLSMLSEAARFSLDSLAATQRQPLHLHLQGNPLACTCAMVEFMRWLGTTRVALDRGGDYTCVTDSGQLSSTGVEARQWMNKWRRCVGPTALWSAMALLLLMTSLTGAVWGVAKNITRLRFLFTVLSRIRMPQRSEFSRDAYVVYCDEDAEFVCGRLRRELGVTRGVRLLIKDLPVDVAATRFWQLPGDNVPFKILEHIDLSWKVILVLTPALARDDMAGFMTRAALQSVTDRMPRRVLLLYVGQKKLPELASVQALLETVPESQVFFLPLPASPQEQRRVWDSMAQAILE
jgi:hypothetical protein